MVLDLVGALEQLQECLCNALAETSGGRPCFCCIIHSPGPPLERDGPLADVCKCGLAWVRVVDLAPKVVPRQQKRLANGEVCAPEVLTVVTFELGVLRCTNIGDPASGGVKASTLCDCLGAHAAVAAEDMGALVTAATCCVSVGAGAAYERVVPIGNAACAGSTLRLTTTLDLCIDCPESPGESP